VEPGIPNGWGKNYMMVDKYRDILEAMDFASKFPRGCVRADTQHWVFGQSTDFGWQDLKSKRL
jgi:hypothetical protein